MNSIIPVPQALNISPESRSYNWDLFQQAWNNYEIAVGLSEKSNEQRVATLLSIIGYDALQVYNAFYWNNDEQKTVESVMNKFGVYCKPKKNVTYERFTFILLVEDVLKSYRWNEFLLVATSVHSVLCACNFRYILTVVSFPKQVRYQERTILTNYLEPKNKMYTLILQFLGLYFIFVYIENWHSNIIFDCLY